MSQQRVFGLDLMRAIAICSVMIYHGGYLLDNTPLEGFPYIQLIDGVAMFFVLSGFLIGSILLKKICHSSTFKSRELLSFWKRRWFRTLPNYYLILLVNVLIIKFGLSTGSLEHFNFHFFTFTHNFAQPFEGFFWESWSISIEEWFYIFTPLLILISIRFLKPKFSFLFATICMIVLPILYRSTLIHVQVDYHHWEMLFRKTVLCGLDCIGYGLLAAWIYKFHPRFWNKYILLFFVLGISIFLLIINFPQSPNSVFNKLFVAPTISTVVMLCLPILNSIKSANPILSKPITHISKISYSMYLINLSIVLGVMNKFIPRQGGLMGVLQYLLFWIIVILISSILYKYFERPIMNLREIDFSKRIGVKN